MDRLAGTIFFRIGGVQRNAKGNFTYNLGIPKRETMIGPDGVHGYKETPQAAFIEGEITDQRDLDVKAMQTLENETVTLELANGKSIVLPDSHYTHDGNAGTEEANIPVRFEGESADEV